MAMFRLATHDDLAALVDLVNSAYRGESSRTGWTTEADLLDGQRIDITEFQRMLSQHGHAVLTAWELDGRPVACAQTAVEPDGTLYFGMLTVRPDAQGLGLGRELLAALEAHGRTAGCTQIRMTVIHLRHELIAWYERCGFVATGRIEPFPMRDPRYGLPKVAHLELREFSKTIKG